MEYCIAAAGHRLVCCKGRALEEFPSCRPESAEVLPGCLRFSTTECRTAEGSRDLDGRRGALPVNDRLELGNFTHKSGLTVWVGVGIAYLSIAPKVRRTIDWCRGAWTT
jgi:hypothetical protein